MNLVARRLARALVAILIAFPGLVAAQTATAVEYYYAAWDYYFVTSFPDEIAALDGGAFGGVWKRTGQTFAVWSTSGADVLPTCRFFSTAFAPKSSHFYTPSALECDTVKQNASWQYESIAFYLQLPTAAGTCPGGTTILYRLYNNGLGGAPNHRYTTDAATFTAMQALGWTFEGDGRTGAFACVPTVAAAAEGLWRGATEGGRPVITVVLEDGRYYVLYSSGSSFVLGGAIVGTSASAGGTFTSINARSVGFTALLGSGSATVQGTYVSKTNLRMTVGAGATAENVNASYDPGYDVPASVPALAGRYAGRTGHVSDPFPMSATIAADGSFTMTGACPFVGSIAAHGTKGVFDFTIRATSGVCLGGPGKPVSGLLVFDPATQQLAAVGPFADDDMFFMFGTRQ